MNLKGTSQNGNGVYQRGLSPNPAQGFIENKGQVWDNENVPHPEVKFVFNAGNLRVFLLENGIAYQFTRVHYPDGYLSLEGEKRTLENLQSRIAMQKQIREETFRMDMTLVGADKGAEITTEGRSTDFTNFYNRKVLDVHQFQKITYHDIYPGIDWVIYFKNGTLKYDFVVKEQADPAVIQMAFQHHESLNIDNNGNLTLKNILGTITENTPVSFQENNTIETKFTLRNNTVSFVHGEYDASKPLIIDPAVRWATYYGNSDFDAGYSSTSDISGNIYLAGSSTSTVNIASGGHQNTYGGVGDAFLVKFDPNGVRLWGTYYGGANSDVAYSCATDLSGNVYMAGNSQSTVNISFNGHQNTIGGSSGDDAFLVKFNSSGTRIWATYYGGYEGELGLSCSTDGFGNVFIAGFTESVNGISASGHQNTHGGGTITRARDAFLVKFNSSGTRIWGTYYGDNGTDLGFSCSTDLSGNVYLAGETTSSVNIASGGHQNSMGSLSYTDDAFLVKFNSSGTRLWGTYYGGSGLEQGFSCVTDVSGNVYLAGQTSSTNNIASGGHQNTIMGTGSAFLAKFNAGGTRQWATYYGAASTCAFACATDALGNVYLAGYTSSATNIALAGYQLIIGGNNDAFLAKFNSSGVAQWGTYHGGTNLDFGRSCCTDGLGNVYLAGETASSLGIAWAGHQNTFGGGTRDAFLVKICDPAPLPSAIDGNSVVCSPGSAVYTISAIPGATSYSWSLPSGWTGISSANMATVSLNASGVLSVSATNSCSAGPVQTISIIAAAIPTITSSSGTVCSGEVFTIVPSGANTYSITGNTFSVSPTVSTSYSVTGTSTAGCVSSNTAVSTITVVGLPVLSAPPQTICYGFSGTLSASGANSFTWQPNNFSGNSITVSPSVTTIYSLTGTSSVGCMATIATSVVVHPTVALSFITQSITCASLGSATVSANGGLGPYTYTWMPGSQTNSVANNLIPTTYSLTVIDVGTGCVSTATTAFTSLVPLSGSLANVSAVSCHGFNNGSATVTNLSGGSGSQNYLWTNGSFSFTTPTVNNLTGGQWSVTVTDAITSCQVFSVFTISEPLTFTQSITVTSPSICIGGNIVLSSQGSGGTPPYTYTWTNGPPLNTYTVNEINAGIHIYTLTSTDANNCLTSNTIAVNFVSNPTISVSNVSICPLAIGTLTANGATTYTWNNNTNSNVYSDNPLSDTQYTVVGSALGCTAMTTASIILHPVPVPVFTHNSPVCNGSALVLNASGGNSYNWSGPSSFNSAMVSPTITSANPGQSGTYNLTVTSVNGCTANTSSNLTVNPSPTLSATGATLCSSQTLNLVSSSEPGATYLWTGPLNFYSTLQSPSIASLTLNHSGNYSVVATSVLGCTNTTNVNVLVVPPPNLTANLSSTLLCTQAFNGSKNTTTLTSGGANTYTLATFPDMSNQNPNGPISPLTVVPPYSGPGTATVWGSNGVCTVFKTLTFSIIPNPTVIVTPTPVICAGESYTYTSNGASSYTWSTASPGFTTYNNGGVAVAHPSINSVFSVIGGSLGCFSATKTSTITVNPLPKISISPLQPTVCLYRSTQLTATGSADSYLWASAPGLFNGSGPTVSVSPLSQQVYTVTGELDNCFASATTTVNVQALPQPTINTAKTVYCENENITLSGEGGLVYEWRGPNNLYYNKKEISYHGTRLDSARRDLWAGGVYSLTVRNVNGCQSTSTKLITIHHAPQGSLLGYKESGCLPLCTTYDFKGQGSGVSGSWTLNNQKFGDQFKYCFPSAGVYTISGTISDKSTGCDNHLNFVVTVYPKPEADFNFSPLHPIENFDEVKFTNRSSLSVQKWNWYFMNNTGYESTEENISYLFTEPGEYPIVLTVSDKNSCQDTIIKVVKVEPDFTLYIPDAFTPNGDDLNDVFLPVTRSSRQFTLAVFDRWGQRIFYSTSPQSGWDGTYQGAECKVDVYTYKITLSTVSGEKKEYSGHVSLVR